MEPCGHVVCRECLREYLRERISSGHVMDLECPAAQCAQLIAQSAIRRLVPQSLYEKYEKLLLETGISTMRDLVFCPRRGCQAPVIAEGAGGQRGEGAEGAEGGQSKLAMCPRCGFCFCVRCGRSFHRDSQCPLRERLL